MANSITCIRLSNELVTLQAEYQALTGFKWFMFKLTSWNLATALDTFDPADAVSAKQLYTVYEGGWFTWLRGFFDLCININDSLLHRLLSHFGADDEMDIMSHSQADELLSLSEEFGGIHDPDMMSPLLEHDFIFDFVKRNASTIAPNLDLLASIIQLKLRQLNVLNAIAMKIEQPVDSLYDANDDQVMLFDALLQQNFEAAEVTLLVEAIRDAQVIKPIFESVDKKELLLYLTAELKCSRAILPLIPSICDLPNAKTLKLILMQLNEKKCLYKNSLYETFNVFAQLQSLDTLYNVTAREWVNAAFIERLCTESEFLNCLVYLMLKHPGSELNASFLSVRDPKEFRELCVILKQNNILHDSDINLIINDSILRTILMGLKGKENLHEDIIAVLSSHPSKDLLLEVMGRYPDIEINLLTALKYLDLNNVLAINGLSVTELNALLRPDRFAVFTQLNRWMNSNLSRDMLLLIHQIPTSEQSTVTLELLNFLNQRGFICPDTLPQIFERLIKGNNFEIVNRLITETLADISFNEASNESVESLNRLLSRNVKNTLLPLLLACLIEQKVLVSSNLFQIIEVLEPMAIIPSHNIMEAVDRMSNQQLTIDNCQLVLQLLRSIYETNSELTDNMVFALLDIVQSTKQLAEIAAHKDYEKIIKLIFSLKSKGLLTDQLINLMISSDDFSTSLSLLERHNQLTIENIDALMTSSDLVEACSTLQQKYSLNDQNLSRLMDTPLDKVQFLMTVLSAMSQIHFFENKSSADINSDISRIITHPHMSTLLQTISLIEQTNCNVPEVYSLIIYANSFERVRQIVDLLIAHTQLCFGSKAVNNFKRLLNLPEAFQTGAVFSRLSYAIEDTDDEQNAFDTFIEELTKPKEQNFFSRVFGFFNRQPEVVAVSSQVEALPTAKV